ncbi:SIS domain-containing protein [Desulfococcaceae bacterium HSG7]|nr:SIS domain-containing protein [Desulfococcaceae bacterium HSG7]
MNYQNRVRDHLIQSADVKRRIAEEGLEPIIQAANMIAEAFHKGNKMLLCGNGGSAADCQHLATEFVSRLTVDFERQGLPALALTTDTSFLTAYANDCGFEGLFERQVETFGKSGDVLLGISTSGNSVNVIKAVETAKNLDIKVVALTGQNGKLNEISDVIISVPSSETQYIQEAHLSVEHILCDLIECILFGKQDQ